MAKKSNQYPSEYEVNVFSLHPEEEPLASSAQESTTLTSTITSSEIETATLPDLINTEVNQANTASDSYHHVLSVGG